MPSISFNRYSFLGYKTPERINFAKYTISLSFTDEMLHLSFSTDWKQICFKFNSQFENDIYNMVYGWVTCILVLYMEWMKDSALMPHLRYISCIHVSCQTPRWIWMRKLSVHVCQVYHEVYERVWIYGRCSPLVRNQLRTRIPMSMSLLSNFFSRLQT